MDKQRILVVEGDDRVSSALQKSLQDAGLEVRALSTAQAAAEIVFRFRPHLMILDTDLPGYSGIEFHEHVRSTDRGRDINVIFLSRRNDWISQQEAKQLNAAAFLSKSCSHAKLIDRVRDVLVGRNMSTLKCTAFQKVHSA